jgi:hypothetical protein
MIMRSGTTDGSSASKCQGQWTHHAAQRPSGHLEWRRRSAPRPVIAEKPEKREHSRQVGIHLGNPSSMRPPSRKRKLQERHYPIPRAHP